MNGLLIYETSDDFIKILEKYIFDEKIESSQRKRQSVL